MTCPITSKADEIKGADATAGSMLKRLKISGNAVPKNVATIILLNKATDTITENTSE